MNTGYVATIQGSFAGEDVRKAGQETHDGDYEWFVTHGQKFTTTLHKGTEHESVVSLFPGEVYWMVEEEMDSYTVIDDQIRKRTEFQTQHKRGTFLLTPAKNIALLSDEAIRWHVERSIPADIRLPEIDITDFVRNHPDVDQWGTGFGGRLPDSESGTGVEKGAVYGDDVKQDPALGEDLRRGYLNQVGIEYYWRTGSLTAYLAESGYIAAHGDEVGSEETMAWLIEEVQPHLFDDSVDDEQEASEVADPGQSKLGEEADA